MIYGRDACICIFCGFGRMRTSARRTHIHLVPCFVLKSFTAVRDATRFLCCSGYLVSHYTVRYECLFAMSLSAKTLSSSDKFRFLFTHTVCLDITQIKCSNLWWLTLNSSRSFPLCVCVFVHVLSLRGTL